MIKVMFVCHGNICRSPMGEYILKDLLRKKGIADRFHIESSAVSREEIGNDLYPPAKRELLAHGIPCPVRAARQITVADIAAFDHILCMDHSNLSLLARISPSASEKAVLLGNYGLKGKEIEDPWYTGRFDRVYREIETCCEGFLEEVLISDVK